MERDGEKDPLVPRIELAIAVTAESTTTIMNAPPPKWKDRKLEPLK